jgi:RNA polymerase sigma factor (sigma-70 family)
MNTALSLVPFLEANGSADSDERLAQIVEEALPVIRSIIKSKLQVSLNPSDGSRENQDALEINGEVQVSLISALRRLQEERRPFISNFQSYVAVIAFNACYGYLRRKRPRRHSLKNKLRYLLTHRVDFSVWEIDGVMFGGLTAWRFQKRARASLNRLQCLADTSGDFRQHNSTQNDVRSLPLMDLVFELFHQAQGPVELDALVGIVANLQGVKEERLSAEAEGEEATQAGLYESLPDDRCANPAVDVERRLHLERLWSEIQELPVRQRAALLLNLRDSHGGAGLTLFPATGVASLRRIASALEMPVEELSVLWAELPLDDARIAGRLGVTRQQVINLRKSARERLARRMKALW